MAAGCCNLGQLAEVEPKLQKAKYSLRLKLTLGLILIISIIFAGQNAITLYAQQQSMQEEARISRDTVAQVAYSTLTGLLASDDLQSEAAVFTDMNADGYVDLYVSNIGPLQLGSELGAAEPSVYLSSQGRYFTRRDPAELGIAPPFGAEAPERGACCADFDGDANVAFRMGSQVTSGPEETPNGLTWPSPPDTTDNAQNQNCSTGEHQRN